MIIRHSKEDSNTQEYGGSFRRIFPWPQVETPDWGGAWMVIAPQSSSTPHDHDEEETFFVLSGNGEMTVDDETRVVGPGDMIYLPRFSRHTLKNIATNEDLKILCIWWGAPKD